MEKYCLVRHLNVGNWTQTLGNFADEELLTWFGVNWDHSMPWGMGVAREGKV